MLGYIILDTETGAGAYKITGGGNGGFLKTSLSKIFHIVGLVKLYYAIQDLIEVMDILDDCIKEGKLSKLGALLVMLFVFTKILTAIAFFLVGTSTGIFAAVALILVNEVVNNFQNELLPKACK